MTRYEIKHHLRDLRPIDVDNLKCGRITNIALLEAIRRSRQNANFTLGGLDTLTIATISHCILADELNDMLEAASALKSIEPL
jgi:hypothetical protein